MDIAYKDGTADKPDSAEKLYRVQAGAYTVYANAVKMKEKVITAGFDAFISES